MKKRGGKKAKSKSQDCCVTFKPKILKFCFLHMPKLCKLIFCNWIRNPQSVRPVNGFMVSFSSLWHDRGPENHLTSFKIHFLAKFPGMNGLRNSLIRPTILEKPTATLSFRGSFIFYSYFLFYLLLVFSHAKLLM